MFLGRAAGRRAALPLFSSGSLARPERRGAVAIFNRRNAFVGWLVLRAGKIVAREKAKQMRRRATSRRRKSR
jgi:hypothetical protein